MGMGNGHPTKAGMICWREKELEWSFVIDLQELKQQREELDGYGIERFATDTIMLSEVWEGVLTLSEKKIFLDAISLKHGQ